MNNKDSNITFNFYDFLLLILKHKYYFIIVFILVAVSSSIIALLLPQYYKATTVLLPPSGGGMTGVPAFLSKELAGLASGFGLETSSNEMYQSILESRTLKERIIKKHNIREAYKVSPAATAEDMLRLVNSRLTVKTRADFTIEVSYVDLVPTRAAEIANSIVKELDFRVNEISTESARNSRIFLEQRLNETNSLIEALQDSMILFQKNSGVIALNEQVGSLIKALGDVKAEQMALDIERQMVIENFGSKHPIVTQYQSKADKLQQQYSSMLSGEGFELLPELESLPEISKRYLDLLRQIRIQTTLLEFIFPQYENARIQEQKESVNIQVLDYAQVPQKRFKPARTVLVLTSVSVAMLLTILLIVFLEYWRQLPEKNSADFDKLNQIKELLFRRSKK